MHFFIRRHNHTHALHLQKPLRQPRLRAKDPFASIAMDRLFSNKYRFYCLLQKSFRVHLRGGVIPSLGVLYGDIAERIRMIYPHTLVANNYFFPNTAERTGEFAWTDDSARDDYALWQAGQPILADGQCASLRTASSEWLAGQCSARKPFVCQALSEYGRSRFPCGLLSKLFCVK